MPAISALYALAQGDGADGASGANPRLKPAAGGRVIGTAKRMAIFAITRTSRIGPGSTHR